MPVNHGTGGPPRPFRFANLLARLREHPGEPACIAIYSEGNPTTTQRRIYSNITACWAWLAKNYPLEAWEFHVRTDPLKYNHRAMWACFHGEVTVEQAQALKAARLERATRQFGTKARKKAIARARVRAEADEVRRNQPPGPARL
jgi:hypothetical protein